MTKVHKIRAWFGDRSRKQLIQGIVWGLDAIPESDEEKRMSTIKSLCLDKYEITVKRIVRGQTK